MKTENNQNGVGYWVSYLVVFGLIIWAVTSCLQTVPTEPPIGFHLYSIDNGRLLNTNLLTGNECMTIQVRLSKRNVFGKCEPVYSEDV